MERRVVKGRNHLSSEPLNSDKTEMLVLGPKKQRDLLLNLTTNPDGCTVVSNKTVKDLGVTLDPDLSFEEHILFLFYLYLTR